MAEIIVKRVVPDGDYCNNCLYYHKYTDEEKYVSYAKQNIGECLLFRTHLASRDNKPYKLHLCKQSEEVQNAEDKG